MTGLPNEPESRFGMIWGIKRSFLAYLARQPGTRDMFGDGAGKLPTGQYSFDLSNDDDFDAVAPAGTLKFRGTVRLIAHRGHLVVTISDPWIVLDERGSGRLSISTRTSESGEDSRRDLLDLNAPRPGIDDRGLLWTGIEAALTASAVDVFNEVYPPGEPLDPLTLRLPGPR